MKYLEPCDHCVAFGSPKYRFSDTCCSEKDSTARSFVVLIVTKGLMFGEGKAMTLTC